MPRTSCIIAFAMAFLGAVPGWASDIELYQQTWVYRALLLQNRIDWYAPLAQAAFVATHNSYNSRAYSRNGTYIDPNQTISVYDQLEIGVRALELDVHFSLSSRGRWPWQWRFSRELMLSHARGDLGTHPNDRLFRQGLAEIRDWLDEHPNEVIIVYIEDQMEGQYARALSDIEDYIGDLVYQADDCRPLPMDMAKADVRDEGKQILLVGGNCATAPWAAHVFQGHFSATVRPGQLRPWPSCTIGELDSAYLQSNLVRVLEDSTRLSALVGRAGPSATAEEVAEMAQCGLAVMALDHLLPFDRRLEAQIWSWAPGEPNDAGGEDCAEQGSEGRFNDLSCELARPVACQNPLTSQWMITVGWYSWAEGHEACGAEFPEEEMLFSVPVNGYHNATLAAEKSRRGVTSVWLNYSDQHQEGRWVPSGLR
jgi:hypothetical protein